MKFERIAWIALSALLMTLLALAHKRYTSLEGAVLAKEEDSSYTSAAAKLFVKGEGVSQEKISADFYVSYLGFGDRSCVRFIPKRHVRGGSTTYCFTKKTPIELIGIDREAE